MKLTSSAKPGGTRHLTHELNVVASKAVVHRWRPPCPQVALPTRVRMIVESVAERHGFHARDVLSASRRRAIFHARAETAFILRQMQWGGKRPSFPQIGRWLNRDHASIMNAIRRYEELAA